ncbi:hypothetical protein AB0D04_14395 [Streptomyces sp. NPDC048483]|uniref:hypothetical protein n=1 Tax=Streptomyces sp. NPDC048483 TaxID=3154927 RepID=UPI003431EDDE
MRRTTTVASASAAMVCLGVLLTGCGSAAHKSYVAVGAAGPADGRAPTKAVPPEGGVELTPLDGDDGERHGADTDPSPGRPPSASPSGTGSGDAAHAGKSGGGAGGPAGPHGPDAPGGSGGNTPNGPSAPDPSGPSMPPGSPGNTGPGSPTPPSPTIPAGPDAPAGLLIGKPDLADTDVRWCEKVTLDFLNTGKHAVTEGTVTFGTHVIGALGVDWSTLHSTRKLPLPLAPGEKRSGTWRVCVDAWRVPLGMHIDTKDVAFHWK